MARTPSARILDVWGAAGTGLLIYGGRQAMGSQQFETDTILLDLSGHARVSGTRTPNVAGSPPTPVTTGRS